MLRRCATMEKAARTPPRRRPGLSRSCCFTQRSAEWGDGDVARAMKPTDDERGRLFRDSVYYEIIHTFGVPAELPDDQLDSHAIGETVNFSRHVHARALSHFLFRRPSDGEVREKNDDAFAEDFGFDPTALGLSDGTRKAKVEHKDLNKGLIHITYGRVTGAKPWSSQALKELLPVTIQFMKHILDKEKTILPSGGDLFANQQEREGWKELLACLERCQLGKRLRYASGFNGLQTWYTPSTHEGAIAALYGAKEKATPPEAVCLSTTTNTAPTTIQVLHIRSGDESS